MPEVPLEGFAAGIDSTADNVTAKARLHSKAKPGLPDKPGLFPALAPGLEQGDL